MKSWLALTFALVALLLGTVWALNQLDDDPAATLPLGDAARGAYLAQAGHCAGCHTARGGAAYAGGTALPTPFGTVHAPNLTPDRATGLGAWTAADFWRALHNGRSAGGRLLAPACPYPNFTRVSRADAADLFAFLQGLPAVAQPNRPHALRWPYGTQAALAVWRALYFRPGTPPADRGEYLVAGLGHCSACHGRRNAWGATDGALDLRGGAIPQQGWFAPALDDPLQAGVATWPEADIVALLQTGQAPQAGVSGPMAMVVARSTQHLSEGDLRAMARFLKSLPQRTPAQEAAPPPPADLRTRGERVYEDHCASCHGRQGEGAPPAAPALAGNRAVALASPDNVVRVVLGGGFGPATAGRPRPFGMPPFATQLGDEDIAAVVSYVRSSWGHRASSVDAAEVNRQRGN